MDCGVEIKECMGFVLAGDFVKAANGEIPWTRVRERCGLCVERIQLAYEARMGWLP